MKQKALKFVTVTTFVHLGGATYNILNNFKRLVESGIISCKDAKLAKINYDPISGINEGASVKIFFSNNTAVFLNLPAGFEGKGPEHLCKIIKMCFPNINDLKLKQDLLTFKDQVNISYTSESDVTYQFSCNGEYYYSF